MRLIPLLSSAFFLLHFATIAQNEPKLNLEVTFNGQEYRLEDGDTLSVDGNTLVVKTSDNVTFDDGAIRFDYPRNFAFSHEKSFGYESWSLDGNDLVISYFQLGAELSIDLFTEQMVEKFGRDKCEVEDRTIKLGKEKLKGKRIIVTLFGHSLTYDLYKLDTKDGDTHFLTFQDSRSDDGSESTESAETMALVKRTFVQK